MMRHPLHVPTFSHFSRTPTCGRQTDRQTHDDGICIYRASMALRGKNCTLCYDSTVVLPNIIFHYHLRAFPPGRGGGSEVVWAGSAIKRCVCAEAPAV